MCVRQKNPLLRVGLPINSVMAPVDDMDPLAASNTCSGMPLASSAISNTLSLCMPAMASGVSGLDVRAVMKHSASDFRVM